MGKRFLKERKQGAYYNWDSAAFRRQWTLDPNKLLPAASTPSPLLVLDEIHKQRLWKRQIKGVFDTLEYPVDMLITGSSHLNVYRRGSDSLLGRYFHFTLHPFSLNELSRVESVAPDNLLHHIREANEVTAATHKHLAALKKHGPFPEPLFSQDARISRLWQRSRTERLIREDLRDLSRLSELSSIEVLRDLLPERVASPLAMVNLARALEVSSPTVKRWLGMLAELYYCYLIPPYHKRLSRVITKMPKLYLWDWSELHNSGALLENMVASHLFKYCQFYTETGYGEFDLYYLRNRQGQEIDFLLTADKNPWLAVEVKSGDTELSPHWRAFLPQLPGALGVQVTTKKDYVRHYSLPEGDIVVMDIARFLSLLA